MSEYSKFDSPELVSTVPIKLKRYFSPQKVSLWVIMFTIFLDLLGVGLVLPILPFIFAPSGIFGSQYDAATINILYGLLIAAYPLSQLFGAPILGYLSDIHGRKKILSYSVFGTVLSLLWFGIAINTGNLWLMFFSRICDGLTGGNLSIAQSVIADVSEPKEKTHNFGLISVALAMGMIIGPVLSGFLSNNEAVSWFNYSTPYYFAAILSSFNLVFVHFFLTETATLRHKSEIPKFRIWNSFAQLYKAFTHPKLSGIFVINFLFVLSFSLFTNFLPRYLQDKFAFSKNDIINTTGYVMLWVVFSQAVILRFIGKKLSLHKTLSISLIASSWFLLFLLVPTNQHWFYLILPLVAIFQGLAMPNITTILSNSVGEKEQGEILGINQSVQAFGTIAPAFAGFGVNAWIGSPVVVASISCAAAWLILTLLPKSTQSEPTKEL